MATSIAPLQHGTITVGTTAQTLLTTPVGVRRALVVIRNNDSSKTIYIGDGTVTASGANTSVSFLWSAGN